ncbi:MAG: LptF/LptG family permease [Candidatus Cloacimonetes bacterium]|nr:LptF/LptG family permease [Candidatus Cloacimonadota bacterium]
MKILERYILRENLQPFMVSLVVITFVMLLDHLIDLLNLIIDKQLDVFMIGSIFGLSLPFILALSIPMSVLTASIMSFGRLSVDNELVAFKSCGINIYALLRPTVIAALLLSAFMVYFNNTILPGANHKLKNVYLRANYRRPITALKPGVFTELQRYTIYVREHDGDEMRGIMIYNSERRTFPQTISAARGDIVISNAGNTLRATLFDGEMHVADVKDHNRYEVRKFNRFVLNLPDLGFSDQGRDSEYRGDRELSSAQLHSRIEEREQEIVRTVEEMAQIDARIDQMRRQSDEPPRDELRKQVNLRNSSADRIEQLHNEIRIYEVEYYKKFAIAFACIIFVLVGAPVGMMTRTSGVGMSFSVSSLVFLVYYVSLIGGEELADRGFVAPWLAMWISNIMLGAVGIWLITASVRETKFIDLSRVKYFLNRLLRIK